MVTAQFCLVPGRKRFGQMWSIFVMAEIHDHSEPLPPPWRPPRVAPLVSRRKLAWRLIIFSSRRWRFRGDKLFSLPPGRSFKNAGKLSSVKHLSETPYIYILRASAAEIEGEVVLQRKAGLEYWLGSEALLWSVFFCVFVHCLETVWLFWPVRYFCPCRIG